LNESTIKAIQGIIGVEQDGKWGPKSALALEAIVHPVEVSKGFTRLLPHLSLIQRMCGRLSVAKPRVKLIRNVFGLEITGLAVGGMTYRRVRGRPVRFPLTI